MAGKIPISICPQDNPGVSDVRQGLVGRLKENSILQELYLQDRSKFSPSECSKILVLALVDLLHFGFFFKKGKNEILKKISKKSCSMV